MLSTAEYKQNHTTYQALGASRLAAARRHSRERNCRCHQTTSTPTPHSTPTALRCVGEAGRAGRWRWTSWTHGPMRRRRGAGGWTSRTHGERVKHVGVAALNAGIVDPPLLIYTSITIVTRANDTTPTIMGFLFVCTVNTKTECS